MVLTVMIVNILYMNIKHVACHFRKASAARRHLRCWFHQKTADTHIHLSYSVSFLLPFPAVWLLPPKHDVRPQCLGTIWKRHYLCEPLGGAFWRRSWWLAVLWGRLIKLVANKMFLLWTEQRVHFSLKYSVSSLLSATSIRASDVQPLHLTASGARLSGLLTGRPPRSWLRSLPARHFLAEVSLFFGCGNLFMIRVAAAAELHSVSVQIPLRFLFC